MQMIRYTIALLAVDFINLSNALNSLETTFSGTTFQDGDIWSITTKGNVINVERLAIHMDAITAQVHVYVRPGVADAVYYDSYTKVFDELITGQGQGSVTLLPSFATPIEIPANSTYTIYSSSLSSSPQTIYYSAGALLNAPFASDDNIDINEGYSARFPFKTPVSPTRWNGVVYYSIPQPSAGPSQAPSTSMKPSKHPSLMPSMTAMPSLEPSEKPTLSASPTILPSLSTDPSNAPSLSPTETARPSVSAIPTLEPSLTPSVSIAPSGNPSFTPSKSLVPSAELSLEPSNSREPSSQPSLTPSKSRVPSGEPSFSPSFSSKPSSEASVSPTMQPSVHSSTSSPSNPTYTPPSPSPSAITSAKSLAPSKTTSGEPSTSPSSFPTSVVPSTSPTIQPVTPEASASPVTFVPIPSPTTLLPSRLTSLPSRTFVTTRPAPTVTKAPSDMTLLIEDAPSVPLRTTSPLMSTLPSNLHSDGPSQSSPTTYPLQVKNDSFTSIPTNNVNSESPSCSPSTVEERLLPRYNGPSSSSERSLDVINGSSAFALLHICIVIYYFVL